MPRNFEGFDKSDPPLLMDGNNKAVLEGGWNMAWQEYDIDDGSENIKY